MFQHQIHPSERDTMNVLEHLQATGEIVPAQLPSNTDWSPEKALAAATLASALIEIRDHSRNPSHQRLVAEELEWVRSESTDYLYSFERICDLLDIEPAWVRRIVEGWLATAVRQRSSCWRKAA